MLIDAPRNSAKGVKRPLAEPSSENRSRARPVPSRKGSRMLTWLTKVYRLLGRRHRDILAQGWPQLVFLLGLTIFAGCSVADYWQRTLAHPWLPMMATKLTQVALMLFLVVRLRPVAN